MQGHYQRLILIPLLFLATACGTSAQQGSGNGTATLDYTQHSNVTDTTNPFTGGTASPTPTPAPGTTTSTATPLKYVLRGTGYTQTISFDITTKDKLKIKFIPGVQDTPVTGTAVLPLYSQLAVDIVVGDNDAFTPLLGNGASTSHPKTASDILDFSGDIPACDDGTLTCVQAVTVVIQKPNYDYYQYNYNQYVFFDPTTGYYTTDHEDVYKTHPWNGLLYVETNFTRIMAAGLNP